MNQKRYHYEINNILKRKERRLCNMFKILIIYIYIYLLKKIYKMGCLDCSGVPVLYVGTHGS
jgi:hypothetical protein